MLALVIAGFAPYALFATRAPAERAQLLLGREAERTVVRYRWVHLAPPQVPQVPRILWPATVPLGTPVGRITVPAAGVRDDVVVEGTDALRLEEGPGHYPGTALPGEPGNIAIAGHRTTWLRPFYDLQAAVPGDRVILSLDGQRWVYVVDSVRSVLPSDVAVAAPTRGWTLTLTTCTPRYSAVRRLVVSARLDVPATLAAVTPALRPAEAPRHVLVRRVRVVRVVRLPPHRVLVDEVPRVVLLGWAAGAAACALLATRRRRAARVLLVLAAAACCLEAYGAVVTLLPPTW